MRKLCTVLLGLMLLLGTAALLASCSKKSPEGTPDTVEDSNAKAKSALGGAPVTDAKGKSGGE